MKKIFLGLFGLVLSSVAFGAAMTADQQYIANHLNGKAFQIQLGDLLANAGAGGTVSVATTFSAAVIMSSTLAVSGATTLSSTLAVGGASTLTGAVVTASTVAVNGSLHSGDTLTVKGPTTGSGATVLGIVASSGTSTSKSLLFQNPASSGRFNWKIGSELLANDELDIVASTAADGASFGPVANLSISAAGAVAVSGQLTVGGALKLTNVSATGGTVATVLGTVGPTGSHTTVQTWLQVVVGSTTYYVPAF